jgi:hypothetical protein
MPTLTSTQIDDINEAIDAVQRYIDNLQSALAAAANAGNTAAATTIESRYDDAQLLESKLKALLTINEANSLQASVQSINTTTAILQQQKTQIDNVVKAVDTAATVLGDITSIAAAVAKLVATIP